MATEDDPEGTQETFLSHLVELRSRLVKSIIAVAIMLDPAGSACVSGAARIA